MPAVLVHGVPETARLWNSVRSHLHRQDVVRCRAPRASAPPRPDGFGATMDEYAAWLTGQLETPRPPIDLVGHDWGAGSWCGW